jgi:hypothetical protein
MDQITSRQAKQLNAINTFTEQMDFGDIIHEMIEGINGGITPSDFAVASGTPVNANDARRAITVAGVCVAGETFTVNNPAVAGSDVYEFTSDAEQTVTVEGNIPVDISASTTQSTVTLTVDTQPSSGDTMTIGTKVYTFVPVGTATADGEVSIGTTLPTAHSAIVAAINGSDNVNTPHPLVSASAFLADVSTITALRGGVAGDTIASTESFTAGTNVFSATTLTGGADCTKTNAAIALGAAMAEATGNDTQGVYGYKSSTDDIVTVQALVAGTAGNSISISTTATNLTITGGNPTVLDSGVNGTLGVAGQVFFDATYLYLCTADNTISGENWRRIAVGSAY